MQEKFRQAGENLDDLNRWLERVEREIASQEIPQENVDSLKNQIKSLKVRGAFHSFWQSVSTKIILENVALSIIIGIFRMFTDVLALVQFSEIIYLLECD